MNKTFANEKVSASAGSGKTHALTSRFIALTQYERNSENLPDPTGIIALTFTKKSAGEFLTKILTRLAKAIENDDDFQMLNESFFEITKNNLDKKTVKILLEQSVKNIDKLKLSTIDSFFGSVLKVFTNELGIFTPMQIIDSQTLAEFQKNIIEFIFENTDFENEDFKNFIQIIKKDSGYNDGSSSLSENLQNAITKAIYLDNNLSENISFGDICVLKSSELIEWSLSEYITELKELEELIIAYKLPSTFKTLLSYLEKSDDKSIALSGSLSEEISEKYANFQLTSDVLIPYGSKGKTHFVPEVVAKKLNSIFTRLHDAHIAKYFSASKLIGEILNKYKYLYFKEITSNGLLTFDDVPTLLNSCEKAKELLEFRLDAKFKHWLFDEFQDTSRKQWKFFAGIIDRITNPQDGDDPNKTFFYVGDIKQSLYSWRGGDKELFKEIFEKYKEGNSINPIGDSIKLTKSYRSHANIIKIVNEIFNSSKSQYIKDVFDEEPTNDFLEIFEQHSFNDKNSEKTSISQLRVVTENEDFYDQIVDIINEVQPTGKTIGILVNKNEEIQKICNYLRSKDIQVAPEGTKNLAQNNMLAAGFIQLLKHLAHPKDTASLQYLKMTAFAEIIKEDEDYRYQYLKMLSTGKYAKFFKDIFVKLNIKSSNNYRELLDACNEFEASKNRGIDNLINFLENKEIALSSNSNFVQVMTIHKSKGLEFSTVILPHLEGVTSVKFGGLQVVKNSKKSTISFMPPKGIIDLNNTLKDTKAKHRNNAMFENICKLYVALTRAENALYVVINKKSRGAGKISTLLSEAFFRAKTEEVSITETVETFNVGNAKWYNEIKAKPKVTISKNIIKTIESPTITKTSLETISPSTVDVSEIAINKNAIKFGNAVHKVLEQIKFIEGDIETSINCAIAEANIDENLVKIISNILKKFFANSDIISLFTQRDNIDAKNEYEFISELNGDTISGKIDRLILKKDSNNNIISADIIDYKSTYAELQKTQLSLYKKAIQSIYKLDESQISMHILAYSTAEIYPMGTSENWQLNIF